MKIWVYPKEVGGDLYDLSYLDNGLVYHGSTVSVKDIDLRRCKTGKDFGLAFYLTTSESQAISWARIVKERRNARSAVLNVYRVSSFVNLESVVFPVADYQWLDFVVGNRLNSVRLNIHSFHVVVGPVSDDSVNDVIYRYINGLYDNYGDRKRDKVIYDLRSDRLVDQVALCSLEAIRKVKHIGSEKV